MIETERLKLIVCEKKHLESYRQSERDLADLLEADAVDGWLIFPESLQYIWKMLEEHPQESDWGMRFFIHKPDKKLIGVGGFKGAADENGMVEIGYSIAPVYENQGLATESARAMIDFAFSHSFVKLVDAHTLAEENASTKILQKCGMTKIAEKHDAEDGDIWQWRITREEFEDKGKKLKGKS